MNLYKRIYEAVNDGIQKALIIKDDQSEDSSVIFHHKKISNDIGIQHYVYQILNSNNLNDIKNTYNELIAYYKNNNITYSVKSFDELLNIFNKIKNIKNVKLEWISNISKYVSIILKDNTEIQHTQLNMHSEPRFIKISNEELKMTDNEILIHTYGHHFISIDDLNDFDEDAEYIPENNMYWHQEDSYDDLSYNYLNKNITDKNIAIEDIDGYKNCIQIKQVEKKLNNPKTSLPAINYCLNITSIPGYQGYLPAIGQLMIIYKCIDLINYMLRIMRHIDGYAFQIDTNCMDFWSSTEANQDEAWQLVDGKPFSDDKLNAHGVFPFFKKIN